MHYQNHNRHIAKYISENSMNTILRNVMTMVSAFYTFIVKTTPAMRDTCRLTGSKKYILYIYTSCLVSIFFLLSPCQTDAASLSLGIFPPVIRIDTTPGGHIQQAIAITNYSDKPAELSISLKSFVSSPKENGEIEYVNPSTDFKNFISDDVRLLDNQRPINQLLLSPKEKRSLMLDISLPKDQKESEYYLSILFVTNNRDQVGSNVSFITQGIASNILISIANRQQTSDGIITSFTTSSFLNQGPVPFQLLVTNTSSHYSVVSGNITIKNVLFNTEYIIPIQPTTVLAKSSRFMTNDIFTEKNMVVWNKKFLFGLYKVDANIKFENNPKIFHKTLYFSAYPLSTIIISVISTIFIGILAIKIIKKHG